MHNNMKYDNQAVSFTVCIPIVDDRKNVLPLLAKGADLTSHFVVLVFVVLCTRLEVLVLVNIERQLLNESVVYFVVTTPQNIIDLLLGSSSFLWNSHR